MALTNAPLNGKLIAPHIQRDIINVAACEVSKSIIGELDGCLFSVLINESLDVSVKEHMVVVL